MVSRKTLECDACGSRTVTRTQVGHGDSQVHAFPCPSCGAGIVFVLNLDQEAVTLAYDPNPTNAHWVDTEDGAAHTRAFITELLVPKSALDINMGVSPFISVVGFFSDWMKFGQQEADRRQWAKEAPPVLARLKTHLERANADLFAKDIEQFGRTCNANADPLHRLRLIGELERMPGNLLALPRPGWFDRVQQRVAYAWAKDSALVRTLVEGSVNTGRSLQIWHELAALSERFGACYPYVGLLLQPAVYWRTPPSDLAEFVVCDKRFPELKQLYVEAFETLCRLSVIAIGLEAINLHGSLEIPTKKSAITLAQYDALPNGQKSAHLGGYPIADMFTPFMDTGLRNGIGHNTARYEPANDEVVWVVRRGAKHSQERFGYTAFCNAVLELLSTLVHVQEYFFAVHVRAGLMPWP